MDFFKAAEVIGVVIVCAVAAMVAIYAIWTLYRAYEAKQEIDHLRARMNDMAWERRDAINIAGDARYSVNQTYKSMAGIEERLKQLELMVRNDREDLGRAHNMANVALGLAKKHEVDSEQIRELQEQVEGLDDCQDGHIDATTRKLGNLNQALNTMFTGLRDQGQAIETLRKTKAPARKKPAAKKPAARKRAA